MVAKGDKSRSASPRLNFRLELDNRALKAKNSTLTQAITKLQKDNAELVKQLTLLQKESFETNSKYNNLKNVISIIDSTTKTCLPKINEVVETFTGIIQLCSVAANISNFTAITSTVNRDARTQAVKPQIVNGHILHNPTITLSRLSNNNHSETPPGSSRSSNNMAGPSTSNSSLGSDENINRFSHRNQDPGSDSDSDEDVPHGNKDQNSSFVCNATRLSCRKTSDIDMLAHQEDFSNSDEENEEPVEEEEESDGCESHRLTTIHEMEEEEEQQMLNSVSPRSRQRRFVQGRLQEVRIYLNQLPNTYIEQFRGSGNISISVSPPERRSSFKHRPSSLVNEVDESVRDNGRLYLDEVNCSRMSQGETSFNDSSRQNQGKAKLNVTLNNSLGMKSPDYYNRNTNLCSSLSEQFSGNISTIHGLETPSTSAVIHSDTNSMQTQTLQELDTLHIQLQHKTSTPITPRMSDSIMANSSRAYDSPNRSKSDSLFFRSNITKRKVANKEKRKVAQVLLNRLSLEKRLSNSPAKVIEGMVDVPLIRKSSEMRKSLKNDADSNGKNVSGTHSEEENVKKQTTTKGKGKRKKRDSPIPKAGDQAKPKTKSSPPKASTRPKRAARPKTLKEPNLTKKLRRSK
ncbi:serine/threonine-protein kinase pakA-like isoform X2 [Anoplophora glabripennis]|uniref:serine/threonine-protein kinase pakA-like isoform X2 n=1 Tax=Anoplophora glabripennis TaxID=217634 RepID=UPI0008742503|nr:serine/threonine-protein kinase pakA-like isoform X2 [Anoplophora glabripennis]